MDRPAAIILAAGASRRMGQPKALLLFDGEMLLARVARVLSRVAGDIVAVTGAYPDLPSPVRSVHNPQWEQGQLTSLQAGLKALNPNIPAFFFTPVDCALFSPDTVQAMWQAFADRQPLLAIPRCGGKRGHPVLAAVNLRGEFLALPPTAEARSVVHAHRDQTCFVDVEDEGIHTDLDTPEDYQRALDRMAR